MERNKNYEEYLVESVAYSFEDDDTEEKTEFDMKKISRAEKILHSLVSYDLIYGVKTNMTQHYYYFAKEDSDENFCIVSQEYYDSEFKSWCFPEDSAGNYYEIFRIRYAQSSSEKEFLEFDIYLHERSESNTESVLGYYTVYDITRKQFSQFKQQGTWLTDIETGTKRLYDYNDPELEMTILEIIDIFKI